MEYGLGYTCVSQELPPPMSRFVEKCRQLVNINSQWRIHEIGFDALKLCLFFYNNVNYKFAPLSAIFVSNAVCYM